MYIYYIYTTYLTYMSSRGAPATLQCPILDDKQTNTATGGASSLVAS